VTDAHRAAVQCLYSGPVGLSKVFFPDPVRMLRGLAFAVAGLPLLACSPALNWRQVQFDPGGLRLLLPCKPDRAQKTVPLGGQPTALSMVGCEADGAMFALSVAEVGDAGRAAEVLAQWQALTLSHLRADAPTQSAIKVAGASPVPAPVRVVSRGQHADGRRIEGQAVYFARGARLYQAVVYAPRMPPEAADTFFSSFQPQ
jgi:hypothetical protein